MPTARKRRSNRDQTTSMAAAISPDPIFIVCAYPFINPNFASPLWFGQLLYALLYVRCDRSRNG